MMTNATVQVIHRDGQPEWAVLPYEAYLQLIEDAEMLQDIRDYDAVQLALKAGTEEEIPSEVTFALLDGTNPLKVWREYRGFTQQELAKLVDISAAYLSQLETGKRAGAIAVLSKLAATLQVEIEDLQP